MWTSTRAGLVALSLLAAACGGSDPNSTASPGDATSDATPAATAPEATESERAGGSPPATDAPQAAVDALDFTADTVDGGTIDGITYAGQDVVLWMWAPW